MTKPTADIVPPCLDSLGILDLNTLASVIIGLKEAGYMMQDQGFEPQFSLVPGAPVVMTLSYRMPGLEAPMAAPQPDTVEDFVQQVILGSARFNAQTAAERAALAATAPVVGKPVPDPGPARYAVMVANARAAAGTSADLSEFPAPVAVEPEIPVQTAEAFGRVPAGAAIDATPEVPLISPAPASAQRSSWSEADVDLAVNVVVEAMRRGRPKVEAFRTVADKVGRNEQAVTKYVSRHLLARIDAELLRLADEDALLRHGVKPNDLPAAAVSDNTDSSYPLTIHLISLSEKDGWTVNRDFELTRLAVESGWPMADIALDLGLDSKLVKQRWDLLTGSHEDPKTGKTVRRYAGRDVLACLQQMVGE